ncbi:DUF6928 family protein [Streptomyces anulatus]|uniref:DUF6928 family protein n=1 Tax=Streptomyces anulatus TaxID=1892 RepID=UPI003BB7EC83
MSCAREGQWLESGLQSLSFARKCSFSFSRLLTRSLSLSLDGGIVENIGAPFPFEKPYWAGSHPVEFDPERDEEPYALPFHSSDLGNEALRAFFSFLLEGRPAPDDVDPDGVPLFGFRLFAVSNEPSDWHSPDNGEASGIGWRFTSARGATVTGLAPDVKFIAEGMIRGSMGLLDTMRGARDTAIALGHELARQHGMAGDDEAGRAFAKVYVSAASATLDKMGFSSYVLGETSKGLMRNAREFTAEESRQVAAFLGRQTDLTAGMGDPGADCTENYLGLGRELPEVVGETAWYEQYVPSGGSDRFRGSPEKIRDVAGSWRHAGVLMQRFLEDAQAYSLTASKAHSGEAADAFQTYVKHSVGLTCPPAKAEDGEPLVTNLVAACTQIAKACDRYAEHVEAAKGKIAQHKLDLLAVDMPWDQPIFGGNGYDGGLLDAVLGDSWIRDLGSVGHALDSSAARITLPVADPPAAPVIPGFPFLPPLVPAPAPVPVALASYTGQVPALPRWAIRSTPQSPPPTRFRRRRVRRACSQRRSSSSSAHG